MKWNDVETPLRNAKPTENEIVPLSPEVSTRILFAALRENRRRKTAFWFATPWRTLLSTAAVTGIAYCLVPYLGISESFMRADSVPEYALPSIRHVAGRLVVQASPGTKKLPQRRSTLPPLLPKPISPSVQFARHIPTMEGATRPREQVRVASVAHSGLLESIRNRVSDADKTRLYPNTEEGDMYVAVSGDNILPPETESEEGLTVTVAHDVPSTVSGHAEAAALQALPVEGTTPSAGTSPTIPVWAHVRVQTGQEPEMTLTELH